MGDEVLPGPSGTFARACLRGREAFSLNEPWLLENSPEDILSSRLPPFRSSTTPLLLLLINPFILPLLAPLLVRFPFLRISGDECSDACS